MISRGCWYKRGVITQEIIKWHSFYCSMRCIELHRTRKIVKRDSEMGSWWRQKLRIFLFWGENFGGYGSSSICDWFKLWAYNPTISKIGGFPPLMSWNAHQSRKFPLIFSYHPFSIHLTPHKTERGVIWYLSAIVRGGWIKSHLPRGNWWTAILSYELRE